MRITRKIGDGCEDKTCPAIWETDEAGMIGVQGTRAASGERAGAEPVPGHEEIVFIPAALLEAWASGRQ